MTAVLVRPSSGKKNLQFGGKGEEETDSHWRTSTSSPQHAGKDSLRKRVYSLLAFRMDPR